MNKKIHPRARENSRRDHIKFFSSGVLIFPLAKWADGQVPKSFSIPSLPIPPSHGQAWAGTGKR